MRTLVLAFWNKFLSITVILGNEFKFHSSKNSKYSSRCCQALLSLGPQEKYVFVSRKHRVCNSSKRLLTGLCVCARALPSSLIIVHNSSLLFHRSVLFAFVLQTTPLARFVSIICPAMAVAMCSRSTWHVDGYVHVKTSGHILSEKLPTTTTKFCKFVCRKKEFRDEHSNGTQTHTHTHIRQCVLHACRG